MQGQATEPTSLNIERLNARAKEQIEKKKKLVTDDRQDVKAAQVCDDVQEGARDEQDQDTWFEAVTQVKTVDDNPARPKRCSELTQRFGPDDHSPKEDGRDDYEPIDNGQDDHSPSNYSPDDSDHNWMKNKPRTSTRRRRARGST